MGGWLLVGWFVFVWPKFPVLVAPPLHLPGDAVLLYPRMLLMFGKPPRKNLQNFLKSFQGGSAKV